MSTDLYRTHGNDTDAASQKDSLSLIEKLYLSIFDDVLIVFPIFRRTPLDRIESFKEGLILDQSPKTLLVD